MIDGRMTITVSLAEANRINALISRDTAKAIHKEAYGEGETQFYLTCPTCGKMLFGNDEFCPKCGQRLDTENTEL